MDLKGSQTQLIFHNGMTTIGGTMVEIIYGKDRIIFDFGSVYRPDLEVKECFDDYLKNELIGDLKYIYDQQLTSEKWHENPYEHSAIFLSHCHLDHTKVLNYADETVPVYCLKETKVLIESLNEKGQYLIAGQKTRPIIGVDPEQVIRIGNIEVTLYRVDHDAYGACGMKIVTGDKIIGYTGDLRCHGFMPEDTLHYCQVMKSCDYLIMEAVMLSFDDVNNDHQPSEQEIVDLMIQQVKPNSDRVKVFNCYPANLLRLQQIIMRSPLEVVVEAKVAYLLKQCLQMDVNYYVLDHDYGLPSENKRKLNLTNKDCLWQADPRRVKLESGTLYLHSDAEPLGDFDPQYQPFVEMLENSGVEMIRLSCTGHAYPADLDWIVSKIQPKVLIPLHSFHPERLKNPYGLQVLPTREETVQ